MKAQIESSNSNHLKVIQDGKVHKAKHLSSPCKDEDNAEIKEYLNKLQELVPFMPKNKTLSKLEVISYVIDYIQDLSETLGLPPSPSSLVSSSCDEDEDDFDLNDGEEEIRSKVTLSLINKKVDDSSVLSSRQPLSVIPSSDNKIADGRQ